MNNRQQLIKERLQCLNPITLSVIDDSHQHIGHAGSAGGAGHFSVIIESDIFKGLNTLGRHRLVYNALADLMDSEIHAVSIKTFTSIEKIEETK